MWSLGCVIAELFLGWPLYPGASEYDQVNTMDGSHSDLKPFLFHLLFTYSFVVISFCCHVYVNL